MNVSYYPPLLSLVAAASASVSISQSNDAAPHGAIAAPGQAQVVSARSKAGPWFSSILPDNRVSGSTPSRALLTEILHNPAFDHLVRSRAALSLASLGTPQVSTARALYAAAVSDADPMAEVSLRALGMLAGRSETQYPVVQATIREMFRNEIAAAPSRARELTLIEAIGASGDEFFVHELGTWLTASSTQMRTRAAEAFRRMDGRIAAPVLRDHLIHEPEPAVVTAIVESLYIITARMAPAENQASAP